MFQTKTFNLVHEEENKKYEMLYDPKRCRWMRFIVITALIGFALLLVLVIIDFSGGADSSTNENVTSLSTTTVNINFSSSTTAKDYVHVELGNLNNLLPRSHSVRKNGCSIVGSDNCDIHCFAGYIEDIPEDLTKLQTYCEGYLKVIIEGYTVTSNILKAEYLRGNFRVEYLEIDTFTNMDIDEIENGAFNSSSMANLKTLILDNSWVKVLNESTFCGLSQLQVLDMIHCGTTLKGIGFLQPFAATLLRLMLQQTQSDTVYDPTTWLQGSANFARLWQLDLRNNNFNDTLRPETFAMMTAVKEIYLMESKISHIAEGTFVAVAKTLKLLDLSNNQLITLDLKFLPYINGTLNLELQDNHWDCSCDSYQMLNDFKNTKINYQIEPKCKTPNNITGILFSYVALDCFDSNHHINLYCSRFYDRSSSEEDTSIAIRNYDAYFSIVKNPQIPNTVTLIVKSDMTDLNLIYFIPNNTTYINATNSAPATSIASQNYGARQTETFARTEITIEGLLSAQLYLFCLIPKDELKISPFNCLAHYMQVTMVRKSAWLSKADVAWVITLFVIGLILALCCGTIAVYFLLRWRPTWLCGNGSKSQKRIELNYGEMGDDFCNLDIKSTTYVSTHMAPYESAPTIPTGSQNQIYIMRSNACIEGIIEVIGEDEVYDHQNMNHYEELF